MHKLSSRRVFAVAAVATTLALSAARTLVAQAPVLITAGTGEARVSPDRATIFIGVQSRAATAAAAASDNAGREHAVLDTLRSLGISQDQLGTMNYNVSPEMQYPQSGQPPRVTGYTVTNTVRVDVRRLDDVGKLIDAALAKGSNMISGLQFFSSKADSARHAALAAAIANARADAETMAKAAGGAVGALLEVSNQSGPTPRFEMAMARPMSNAPMPTQIDPGVQTITATVTAKWAFVGR